MLALDPSPVIDGTEPPTAAWIDALDAAGAVEPTADDLALADWG